jgi:NAD(P)-dependent dehydrogenase (short-subunit alcohol dehydrogenase family)
VGQPISPRRCHSVGQPEEIAKAAVFFASDDASFIAGIELFVDGGTVQV